MAHQSLYRTYRPQTFGDVVGQEHIERTLKNAVQDGSVAHAYLFTGPRGTGKTTTARILAKALNCRGGAPGEPDGTCEDCIEIAEGRHPDVYELDAASRTGVDNVREEIIGRVNFAPTRGRYKVYIIDEVHMLSAAAFNALLKTLEEPPSHVVFVMATTHPHKVPETIQSRCQRFDFRRIGVDDIVGRLRLISDAEGFDVPDAALRLIARHAAGGMRDAITTLEQLAAFTAGHIAVGDVEGLLGEVDSAQLFQLAGLVARRDIVGCFRWVARFAEEGTDLAEFVRELTGHVRNLYLTASLDGEVNGVVDASAEEIAQLVSQAAEFGGPDRLARTLDLLGELGAELRWSSDQRLSLEVALTRMARPQGDMTMDALAERVEALERGVSSAAVPPAVAVRPPSEPRPEPRREAEPEAEEPPAPEPVVRELHHAGGLDRSAIRAAWPGALAEIKKLKPGRAQLFAAAEVDVDADGETLLVEFPPDQSLAIQLAEEPEARELLARALVSTLGFAVPVRYRLGKAAERASSPDAPQAGTPGESPVPPRADAAVVAGEADAEDGPIPEYYETGAGFAEPVRERTKDGANGASSSLTRLLTEDLGAQIIAEHLASPDAIDSAAGGQAQVAAGVAPTAPTLIDHVNQSGDESGEDERT